MGPRSCYWASPFLFGNLRLAVPVGDIPEILLHKLGQLTCSNCLDRDQHQLSSERGKMEIDQVAASLSPLFIVLTILVILPFPICFLRS